MRKPPIELVYFRGCPHVDAARAALRAALESMALPAQWQEWDQTQPETPAHLQDLGSPTVLVNGIDVTGAELRNAGRACRADGIPSPQVIAMALQPWRCL